METELVSIYDVNGDREQAILSRAGEIIRDGGLVIFPTETVYGLGADATNAEASRKIYAAKGRPSDNPLIVHIATPEDAGRYAHTSEMYERLAERYMPGPLTVIMPVRETIPASTTAGLDTVAIRCPIHPVARALIRAADRPIAAPSANLSGSPSPTCARHAIDDMMGRVNMIIDGGESDIGVESTIVKIDDDGRLTLLRPGGITPEELREICPDLRIASAVTGMLKPGERVLSPGMKYRHYSPKTPLFLLDGDLEKTISYLSKQTGNIGVICYDDECDCLRIALPDKHFHTIGVRADMKTQAHRLFTLLRDMDAYRYDRIYAPLPPEQGMGLALYNRMIRAAAHQIISL